MAAHAKSEQIILRGRSKAAEGRRTPKRWRDYYGSRVREAFWSAPVPWRFDRVSTPT